MINLLETIKASLIDSEAFLFTILFLYIKKI